MRYNIVLKDNGDISCTNVIADSLTEGLSETYRLYPESEVLAISVHEDVEVTTWSPSSEMCVSRYNSETGEESPIRIMPNPNRVVLTFSIRTNWR